MKFGGRGILFAVICSPPGYFFGGILQHVSPVKAEMGGAEASEMETGEPDPREKLF